MFSLIERIAALLAQRNGDFSRHQLRRLALIWRRTGAPSDLLAYAAFRRNLGYSLPTRWIEPFLEKLPQLSAPARESALALLLERAPDLLSDKRVVQALPGVPSRMPPIVFARENALPELSPTARIQALQISWREEFHRSLAAAVAAGGVCVVGNSGSLLGSGLGLQIDRHAIVIRFNRFAVGEDSAADFGRKLSVWVCAPNFSERSPDSLSRIVVTGPDVRFRLRAWERFISHVREGAHVLTVPLVVWRELVAQLKAPPSAGILTLAWIQNMLGGWRGVSIAGIGTSGSPTAPYHAVHKSQPPVRRHRWDEESALLKQWELKGLTIL